MNNATTTVWRTASKAEPCIICRKPDWCGFANDLVRCMRVSEPPLGWRVVKRCPDGGVVFTSANSYQRDTHVSNSWRERSEQFRKALPEEQLKRLAESLGVREDSLRAVGAGWDVRGARFTFPERDGTGNIIGLSTRSIADGSKRCIKGSARGLTIPAGFDGRDGLVIVVEGATDTASCETLGIPAIGRPSAMGGVEHLAKFLNQSESILILGENDKKPNGSWPGRDGAQRTAELLAKRLGCPIRWSLPPKNIKDVRAVLTGINLEDEERISIVATEFLAEVEDNATMVSSAKDTALMAEPPQLWQSFPTDALPTPVRAFVEEGAKAIGCDPSFVAMPLLSALAGAIGNSRHIQLKRGWTEPAIIWTAIVGESGSLKTPAFKLAMGPIRDRQNDAMRRHKEELAEYEIADLRYQKALAAWKRGKPGDDDPPEKPQSPQAVRYVVSDATVEALAPILSANPRGLLAARDELAGWIGSFDRYAGGRGGADAANWLSLHNGESVVVDRKTGQPRTIYVPSGAVSVTGGVQPGILDRVLGQEHRDSGLLARLLLAMPPDRPKRWTETEVPTGTERAIQDLFDRLFELEADRDDRGELIPRVVKLSPKGKETWITFANAHADEQHELTGDLRAAWSKLEGYAARLALIVHLVRSAANDPTLGDHDHIDETSVAAGVAMSHWFGGEARRIYDRWAESDDDREDRQLADLIETRGGRITARELGLNNRRYRPADVAREALKRLVDRGLGVFVHEKPGQTGGRPSELFRLTNGASVYETPDRTLGKGGCAGAGATKTPQERTNAVRATEGVAR